MGAIEDVDASQAIDGEAADGSQLARIGAEAAELTQEDALAREALDDERVLVGDIYVALAVDGEARSSLGALLPGLSSWYRRRRTQSTVDSWLLWKLTGGAVHATDVTNASRTLLMDLSRREWDDELCELFGVPRAVLPEIRPSAGLFGTVKGVRGLPDGLPIAGIAGDQQAALVGQACFSEGDAKCTYGTGAFLLMNAGSKPATSRHGLLGTVAWQIGDAVAYALEGSAFIAGAVVQWLRDGLGLFAKSTDVEALASKVPDSGGVAFVPAMVGLGAPHWRQDARGLISGINRGTTKAHLARAALEGVAFEIYDLAQAMAQDIGKPMPMLRVDGGASTNDLLMQFQADLLQRPIERPRMVETTALGAAFLAGLGTGVWAGIDELSKAWRAGKQFRPRMKPQDRDEHLARWRKAIQRACL